MVGGKWGAWKERVAQVGAATHFPDPLACLNRLKQMGGIMFDRPLVTLRGVDRKLGKKMPPSVLIVK